MQVPREPKSRWLPAAGVVAGVIVVLGFLGLAYWRANEAARREAWEREAAAARLVERPTLTRADVESWFVARGYQIMTFTGDAVAEVVERTPSGTVTFQCISGRKPLRAGGGGWVQLEFLFDERGAYRKFNCVVLPR